MRARQGLNMLAITGATGRLGRKIATRLANMGRSQRLIVRDPARAPQLPGAEVAQVSSFGDGEAMRRALTGVSKLFLVSARDRMGVNQAAAAAGLPFPEYDRARQQIAAVNAAVEAGVRHIIYLSFLNVAEDATFTLSRDHFQTEEHIRRLGIPFTFLRPSLYMDNIPLRVSDGGVIRAPAGEGRVAWVTRDDIADVAVAVLTGKGHEGRAYDITGPEALTMAETAATLSSVTGREITYRAQTPREARTEHTTTGLDEFEAERRALTGKGLDEYEVEIWITHYLQIAAGEISTVSNTVPELTGHRAQSLEEYLRAHPESYRHLLPS